MFHLGYYRLVADINPVAATDEPLVDCNYTPYHIFVLETRLFPFIYKLYPEASPTFESRYEKGRMEAYLVISKQIPAEDDFTTNPLLEVSSENRKLISDKIREIQSINPGYALIDVNELYDCTDQSIPKKYFHQMIAYTGLHHVDVQNPLNVPIQPRNLPTDLSVYNSFLAPEGIYLSFNPKSDYKTAYRQATRFIVDKIKEFYSKGTVQLANMYGGISKDALIGNWKLDRLDLEEKVGTIYQASWVDRRFAPNITDFLNSRIAGRDWIEMHVGSNMVDRHTAAIALREEGLKLVDFELSGDRVKIVCKTLKLAQRYATQVELAISHVNGQVLAIASHRLADVILYQKYAEKIYPGSEIVIYRDGSEFMFSVMLPKSREPYTRLDELRKEFKMTAIEQLTNVSKISKFKSKSPHAIIEQEYSEQL